MSSRSVVTAAVIATSLSGCAINDEADGIEDGEDASFDAGKADTAGISEIETRGRAIVRFANAASRTQLLAANLSTRVVDNLVAFRAGDDEQLGTDDDGWLMSLAELDAIPFVGPAVLLALVEPALASLPRDPEQVTSCTSTWTASPAPRHTSDLIASPTEIFAAGRSRSPVLYRGSRSGEWSPIESAGAGRTIADRVGVYRLAIQTRDVAAGVPRLVFSTNWAGRWATEVVLPEEALCAAAPFTCDSDPDPWAGDVHALELDERGALHAMIFLTTDDGSSYRALLYATNASGTWKLVRVALGYYSGGWSRGTPELRAAALCTGKRGAAVVFGQYLGETTMLTAATLRGEAIELRAWDRPSTHADWQFGPQARQVACASDGDDLHVIYESGTSGAMLAHATFDLEQLAFTTGPELLATADVLLSYQPQIVIDRRRDRFHVHAEGVAVDGEWRYHYGSGPVGGALETLTETPVPTGGYRPIFQPDLALTPWGAPQVLITTTVEGHAQLYTPHCL